MNEADGDINVGIFSGSARYWVTEGWGVVDDPCVWLTTLNKPWIWIQLSVQHSSLHWLCVHLDGHLASESEESWVPAQTWLHEVLPNKSGVFSPTGVTLCISSWLVEQWAWTSSPQRGKLKTAAWEAQTAAAVLLCFTLLMHKLFVLDRLLSRGQAKEATALAWKRSPQSRCGLTVRSCTCTWWWRAKDSTGPGWSLGGVWLTKLKCHSY